MAGDLFRRRDWSIVVRHICVEDALPHSPKVVSQLSYMRGCFLIIVNLSQLKITVTSKCVAIVREDKMSYVVVQSRIVVVHARGWSRGLSASTPVGQPALFNQSNTSNFYSSIYSPSYIADL